MPIYAYRCATCGHAKDVLQKMSDPVLTDCPACGAASFVKQVTAAGFQLKGSGWYVTDFKGGNVAPPPAEGAKPETDKGDKGDKGDAAKADAPKTDAPKADGAKADAASAAAVKSPAPAPAAGGAAPPSGG